MNKKPILINFSTKPRPDNSWLLKSLLMVAILISLLGGGMGFFYSKALNELHCQESINKDLYANMNEYAKLQEVLESKQAIENEYNAKVRHVTEKTRESYRLSSVFNIAETAIPPNIQIINLKINNNKVTLTGLADDYTGVARMLAALRTNTMLSNTGIISNQNYLNEGKVLFEIETVWEAASRCN